MLTFYIIRQRFITKIVLIVHQQNCLVLFTVMVEDQMFSSFLSSCIKGNSNVNLLEKQCVSIWFIYLCSVPISCFPDLILKIKLFYKYDFCWICNGDQITTFSFILFQQSSWYQNNAVEVKGFFTGNFHTTL